MNYYPLHVGDWVLHTNHLTPEEEGIYLRLLNHYYDTEQPIPEKTDLVIRRLRLGSHEKTVALILEEFFTLEADGWHNLRADSEISAYNEKAERARANGKKGGRPKKSSNKNKDLQCGKPKKTQPVISGNPEETQKKANQEPITNNQEPNINTPQPPKGGAQQITFDSWPTDPSPQVLRDWKKSRKAALTQTAVNRMAKEFHEAATHGYSVDDCLSVCCEAGWRSFKLEWLLKRENDRQRGNVPPQQQTGSNRRTRDMSAIEIATDTSWADDFIPADR